ncbi:MAG: DUF11 domain-containing protein [Phycisphaerales bacterium]|nr:DUF11 domain-containing protein [Phycisphaerales bacterium]
MKIGMGAKLALMAAAGLASSAQAQLFAAADDATTAGIWVREMSTGIWTQLAIGTNTNAWGLASDDATKTLYISTGSNLYKIDYTAGIAGAPYVPTLVGPFGTSIVGLAYGGGVLYGCKNISTEGIYTIDTTLGTSTLLFAYDAGFDLGGLDVWDTDGLIYATSDSTSLSGRGLYQVNQNTTVVTFVTAYPTFVGTGGGTDIDGLAMGGDHAYFVVDEAGEVGVYNMVTATVETPFANPFTTSETFSAGAWSDTFFGPPAQFDASVSMGDSPDPLFGLGSPITYSFNVRNFGSDPITGTTVTVNLSPNVTYVSDTAGGVHNLGVVTVGLGTLPGGGSTSFSMTVTGDVAGFATSNASIAINETDSNAFNDSTSATTEIIDVSDLPDPEVIYSEIVGSDTSLVPGGAGATFDLLNRPYSSPDGSRWIISGQSNIDINFDDVIITGAGDAGTTRVFEGDPAPWDNLQTIDGWETRLSINDSAKFGFTGDTAETSSIDQYMVHFDGTNYTVVAQEGVDDVPGFVGEPVGTMDHCGTTAAGETAYLVFSSTGALPTNQDDFAVLGSTVVAQVGVTIPTNQAGGGTLTWEFFDANDFHVSADGAHYLIQGDLTGTTNDDILVVDGAVVIQEGIPVDGDLFAEGVSTIIEPRMEGDGTWFARGTNATTGVDWIVRNGEVLFVTGDDMGIGTGETWGNATFADTFFSMCANPAGDMVIGGVSSSVNPENDSVVVHICADGTRTELLRQGTPVDLDRNGFFDDGVFIDTFGNDDSFIGSDGFYYCNVVLQDAIGGASLGDAFLRVALPECAVACPADLSGSSDPNDPAYGVPDGMVDSSDFFYYLDQFVAGNLAVADLTGASDPNDPSYGTPDGDIDADDFFFYLDRFVEPCL